MRRARGSKRRLRIRWYRSKRLELWVALNADKAEFHTHHMRGVKSFVEAGYLSTLISHRQSQPPYLTSKQSTTHSPTNMTSPSATTRDAANDGWRMDSPPDGG